MEYLVLIMIISGSLYVSKDYILRGMGGRWKGVSDQFGQGRQYAPNDTVECSFDSEFTNGWYDVTCVDQHNCSLGNKSCRQQAINFCQTRDNFCKK